MADGNDSSRSAWEGTVLSNVNGPLSDPLQLFGSGSESDRSVCMFPSSMTSRNEAVGDVNCHLDDGNSSVMVNRNLKLSQQKLHSPHSLPTFTNNETRDRKFSLASVTDGCVRTGSFESTVTHKPLPLSSSVESNESELSAFPQLLGDANSITSVPTLWPLSYSSFP